ncbi:MAG: hypothetical protein AMXMBFR84_11860 [Candidatus Hydrogenedentota bacterium]
MVKAILQRLNRQRGKKAGMTLVELTLALAIFAIVLGAAAQSLVSFYVALDMQNQRNTALRNCLSIINAMRNVRDANLDNFPGIITNTWPDGAEVPNAGSMRNETVTVDYTNPAANPLEVTVFSQFTDMQGRPMQVRISTMLTNG